MVRVRLTGSPTVSADDVDLANSLTFDNPAESSDSGDSRVFVAPVSGGAKFVLKLDTSDVVSLTRSRRNTYTLLAAVADGASTFLARMDQHVVRVVKTNVRSWFEHSMNKNLVDEYYRRSSQLDERGRTLGRFVLYSDSPPPDSLDVGSPAQLTLQLIGLQFRQQYFTCVWKLLSSKHSQHTRMPAFRNMDARCCADDDDNEHKKEPVANVLDQYGFRDDMNDSEVGGADCDPAVPTAEELYAIRSALMAKLEVLERSRQTRLDDARDMIATLARSSEDISVLAELDARLDDELMTHVP